MANSTLEELKSQEQLLQDQVNEYDAIIPVAQNIAVLNNKKAALSIEINKYLTQDRPEVGTIKRMTSVLGALSGTNAIYVANETAIKKSAETGNFEPVELARTLVTQYAKDIGKNAMTAATGKDYTQGNKSYKDIITKQMGAPDNAITTVAGVIGDITIDANIVGGLKPLFSTIKYLGNAGIKLAKQSPILEKGMDAIEESFNIFSQIEKTRPAQEVEKFKNAFREMVATKDPTKLEQFGFDLGKTTSQGANSPASKAYTDIIDKAFTPGAKDPTSQVGKFLDDYVGTALDKTSGFFKSVLSWSPKFQTRNFMGALTQNIGEGVGVGNYWDAAKLLTTGKGTQKYAQLQETGVLSQPGMFEQTAGQGTGIWQTIKDIPATVATWGEALHRTAMVFNEAAKGTPFLKAVEKTEKVFYKYGSEYLTPLEEGISKIFPFYKFQKGQAEYFPGKLDTVGGQSYYSGMGKIKEDTAPDSVKQYPALTSAWFKDMFTVGSVGNIGFQAEDFFKNITGNVQNIWSQVAPLLKTMTEGVTNYKVFSDKKMSTDTEGSKYKNAPYPVQLAIGYNPADNTVGPVRKWLTDTWIGPLMDGLTTALDPKKGPLRAIFSIREYDTSATSSLRQQEMDRREKGKEKSGWGLWEGFDVSNWFGPKDAEGAPLKDPIKAAETILRADFDKKNKERQLPEGLYDTKFVRTGAPGEQRQDFEMRAKMWDDTAKAFLTAGPDIGKNIAASHGATLEAMMKKADFYGFVNHPDFKALKATTEASQKFLAPRKIGDAPAFSPEDAKYRKQLSGNWAQDYNKMIEDAIAFTSKTAERWRASFVRSPEAIERGLQADIDAAVKQYQTSLGGISARDFKSRIDALKAEAFHAQDDLVAKSHTATGNILEVWANAEIEGIRKIEIQRQAALEKYKGSEEYRRALAAQDYKQTAEMFAGIDQKYAELKRNRIAYEAKILAETNAAMLRDEGAAIVAQLQEVYKRGGVSILEFYSKQLNQTMIQNVKSATDAIDMFMKYMKPPQGMTFPTPQEPNYGKNARTRIETMAQLHPDFKPFITEATIQAVTDGDSVLVRKPDGTIIEIRLANADAPEIAHPDVKGQEHWKGQPYGEEATKALQEMLPVGAKVQIDVSALDKYKRNIGTIIIDNVDANLAMVQKGLAVMYAQFFEDPLMFQKYADAQKQAQEQKKGMWTQAPTEFEPPDKYRTRMKAEAPGFNYKVTRTLGKMPSKDTLEEIKAKVQELAETAKTVDEILQAFKDSKLAQYAEQMGVTISFSSKPAIVRDEAKFKTTVDSATKEVANFKSIYENFDKLKNALQNAKPEEQMQVMKTVYELMRKAIPLGNFEELNQAMKLMYQHYQAVAKAIPDTAKAIYEANKKFTEDTLKMKAESAETLRQAYTLLPMTNIGVTSYPAGGGTKYGTIRTPRMPAGYDPAAEKLKADLDAQDRATAKSFSGADVGAEFKLPEMGAEDDPVEFINRSVDTIIAKRQELTDALEASYNDEVGLSDEREASIEASIARCDTLLQKSMDDGIKRNITIANSDQDTATKRMNVAAGMANTLTQTFEMLYNASGKQSKEMFYLMKAAALAEAMIKGYQAVVAAMAAGASVGGPYAPATAAAYGAVMAAMIGVQVGMILASTFAGPGKAEGGRIDGGSGTRDDVPIMAMGGEYVIRKGSVQKYGENFMEALNKGLVRSVDIPNFAVEIPASNNMQTHFAAGGMVAGKATVPQPEKEKEQNLQIVNVIDPALLEKYLSSTSGQRTLVNVMAANKYELRQIMR